MPIPDWVQDAIFYQIFPDRFARSNRNPAGSLPFEPWDSPPTPHGFKGGDLYGVIEKLDYLKDLGITALYLNPVFESASNHRYHTFDYYNVDPLLGGNDALRELVDKAHANNMRVILDGVFNHASRGFWQFHHVLENGMGSPYRDWFFFDTARLQGRRPWGAYPTPEELQALKSGEDSLKAIGYRGWWNMPALPKFNTNTPAVRSFLFDVAKHWIAFGIDGSETTALPGTLVHLPAGTTHWFRFGKGGGEMISMTSREGASLMFTDLDREISPDKPDLGKLVEVARRHGLAVMPPPK